MTHRTDCEQLDRDDALAPLRDGFDLPATLTYLDGNSLGALPRATAARVQDTVQRAWGQDLIKSWNSAGWMDLPQRVGDKIARLVGANAGELIVADSTSINLYKALSAALTLVAQEAPQRKTLLSEASNFPTDLYIAESLARERGLQLRLVDQADLVSALDDDVAVLLLTHVNYRSGRMHDMAALSSAAHQCGALVVWDLAHSAGAVPVDLSGGGSAMAAADFAVGCGYKYLNGGPGAPAFVWAHPRHASRMTQPLTGWMGHAAPFEFNPSYRPAPGIGRFLSGTPAVLAMTALECGVDTLLAAEPLGGMLALRTKSLALSALFIDLVAQRCAGHPLTLATPSEPALRGSQVSYVHAQGGYAIMQALVARGVIGDFRAGDRAQGSEDLLRFGFTPVYTRFVDVWHAVDQLAQVLDSGEWQEARFHQRAAVT